MHELRAERRCTLVLRPDLVILATATPNDAKIEILRRALDVRRFQRVSISRSRVAQARLSKQQVRVVTFTSEGASGRLVDLNEVAIRAAVAKHRKLKADLASKRISVVPLLLIQVASDNGDPVKMRNLLHTKLGFALETVGVHAAAEPDADVHALARDPAIEVLIFKMAVATGFDAQRAFTLCTLRAVRDLEWIPDDSGVGGRNVPWMVRQLGEVQRNVEASHGEMHDRLADLSGEPSLGTSEPRRSGR